MSGSPCAPSSAGSMPRQPASDSCGQSRNRGHRQNLPMSSGNSRLTAELWDAVQTEAKFRPGHKRRISRRARYPQSAGTGVPAEKLEHMERRPGQLRCGSSWANRLVGGFADVVRDCGRGRRAERLPGRQFPALPAQKKIVPAACGPPGRVRGDELFLYGERRGRVGCGGARSSGEG